MLVIVNEKGEQVKTAKRKVSRIGVDITVSSSPDSRKDSRLKVLDFATQVLSDSSLSQLLPSVCESSLLELLYNRGHERQDQEQTNTVRMCLNAGLIPQFSEEFSVSVGQVNVDLLRTTKTLLERAVRSFSRIFLYTLEHQPTHSNRYRHIPDSCFKKQPEDVFCWHVSCMMSYRTSRLRKLRSSSRILCTHPQQRS